MEYFSIQEMGLPDDIWLPFARIRRPSSLVGVDFISLAPPQATGLVHFVTPPLPAKPASLGFGWVPVREARGWSIRECKLISLKIFVPHLGEAIIMNFFSIMTSSLEKECKPCYN